MAAPQLEFRDIAFSINVRGGASKPLLRGVSGWCAPGEVTALSGPSGGGKVRGLRAPRQWHGVGAGHATCISSSAQRPCANPLPAPPLTCAR